MKDLPGQARLFDPVPLNASGLALTRRVDESVSITIGRWQMRVRVDRVDRRTGCVQLRFMGPVEMLVLREELEGDGTDRPRDPAA